MKTNVKVNKTVKVVILLCCVAVLAVLVSYLAKPLFPLVKISKMQSYSNAEGNTVEMMAIVSSGAEWSPFVKKTEERLDLITDWINDIDEELRSYPMDQPHQVILSGDVKNGKTTFTFTGYLTNASGERVEYNREKTFDFVVDKEPFSGEMSRLSLFYCL